MRCPAGSNPEAFELAADPKTSGVASLLRELKFAHKGVEVLLYVWLKVRCGAGDTWAVSRAGGLSRLHYV